MTGKKAIGIYARTFAALAGAVLLTAQGYSWATGAEFRANALLVGLMLLGVAVAALLAVFAAVVLQPATTRIGMSVRAFLEKLLAGAGVVAFNELADVITFGKLLPPLLIASALAFGVTYLTYVSPTVPTDVPADA